MDDFFCEMKTGKIYSINDMHDIFVASKDKLPDGCSFKDFMMSKLESKEFVII